MATLIVLVIIAISLLYMTNKLPFLHRRQSSSPATHTTANSSTKGEPTNTSSSSSSTPDSTKYNSQSASGPLVAPTGDFVSHHNASLSDSPPGSATITSTCTTTPGAMCQIVFTQGATTLSLPFEATDAGGTAYWNNWKLSDYGFSAGSWTITAVAKSGDQTKSTSDALHLEVTQ